MMKKNYIHNISLLACCLAVCSCMKNELEPKFSEFDLKLSPEVSGMFRPGTKAELIHADPADIQDKILTLYGWNGDTYWIDGATATYSSGKWSLSGSYKVAQGKTYSFLSYANLPSGASVDAPSTKDGDMTLTVTDITAAQEDILLGRGSVATVTGEEDANVDINYSHPYASVQFALGNASEVSKVTGVSITGVYESGKTTFSQSSTTDANGVTEYSWTDLGNANATLEATGLELHEGDTLATFVVIPQNLEDKNVILTISYEPGPSSFIKVLDDGEWKAGYTTTYNIFKNTGEVGIAITDTNKPTNTGTSRLYVRATITGAWYIGDDFVAPWKTTDGTFTGLPGTDWAKDGDYYYYEPALESGTSASALYTSYSAPSTTPVAGATLKLNVLVQAIPYNASKTCQQAFEAL